jgi:vacuolar protein sorting-associated protein 35
LAYANEAWFLFKEILLVFIIHGEDIANVICHAMLIQVDAVLTMLSSLIQDQSDQPSAEEDPEDFAEEQGLLGRSVNSAAGSDSWFCTGEKYFRNF